ncbi:MAG: hypothetical protein IPM79_19690 [Polyangiaceae bacterium]|jgi:hypothetical protein|nr:hypothetical protein [Polyangiaceae bacterium]MBK8939776.1 hypothetical protein [Polyangiaceae bacterium]
MEFDRIADLYNACNPEESLEPDDPRNVDIDQTGVRGEKWSDRLAKQIELSRVPVCQLFTGLRGTGKSTELRRLDARLSDRKRRNFLTVLIDADQVLDLTVEIDVSDVLSLILFQSEKVVLKAEGSSLPALKEGPFARFWAWATTTDVELGKLSVAAGGVGADFNLKSNPTVRTRVREVIANHAASFVKRVGDELSELNLRAQHAGYKGGLFIIFDSLEKLRGTSLTWRDVLTSAERIFANGAPFLQLPVSVLYTVPPALARRMSDPVEYLPMIKVRDKEGSVHKPGLDAIYALIKKRVPEADLGEIFGANDVNNRLRAIALWSGGYPREIVRLLQAVLELEAFPVSSESLERVLHRAGNTYRGIVYDSGAIEWLRTVLVEKQLIMNDDKQREAADLLLQSNVILRYLNADEWFDVHPSVAGMKELETPPTSSAPASGAKSA